MAEGFSGYNPYPNAATMGAGGSSYQYWSLSQTPSPFFTLSGQFTPRTWTDVIRWTKYLTVNSPLVVEVIKKLSSYPITNFVIPTEDRVVKKRYEELIEALDLKSQLINIAFDYHILGNAFVSIYFPIKRMLVCPKCGTTQSIENPPAKIEFKDFKFYSSCPSCQYHGHMEHRDIASKNPEDAAIINWEPGVIAVNYNPISGKSQYWLKISNDLRQKVLQGDPFFLASLPWGMIEAVKNNQDYLFHPKGIFHLKGLTVAHSLPGYGIPMVVSMWDTIFNMATLQRANSAIAAEFMSPLRVVYPDNSNGTNAPSQMAIRNFTKSMRKYLAMHKSDPLMVAFSPFPVGYQQISGDGKAMLVTQEIEQMQDTLLLSLGVSRELLSGTLNWTSSTVGLRLLENTLWGVVDQVQKLMNWLFSQLAPEFNLPTLKVTLEPFKLTDNDNLQQLMANLAQSGDISKETFMASIGLNYTEELDKVKAEKITQAKMQTILEYETEMAQYMALREFSGADDSNGYKAALQIAQETANKLIGLAEGPRRSALLNLKASDPAMYLMVSKLISSYRDTPEYKEETQQAGQEAVRQTEQAQQDNQESGGVDDDE